MPLLPNPITAITQQDLLDLMERVLPDHYLVPLKQGSGYEILQAFAAILARASMSAEHTGRDAQIATSGDGAYSTGMVELYRTSLPTSGEPITGREGVASSIVAGAGVGLMRVSGLTDMSAADVGLFLVLGNCYSVENTGGFPISTYVSPTSVDVTNAAAVVPDLNNGFISWQVEDRNVIVKAGTIVTTSRGGRDFATQADVAFTPLDYGPNTVAVQALGRDYAWNVSGQVTAADGEVLEGEIDTVKTLVEDPPLLDVGIQVRQVVSTSGGAAGTLNALGADRGIVRYLGEQTEQYRARVRALPDTISPDALNRALTDLLRPYGGEYSLIETWQVDYVSCWDAPGTVFPGSPFDPDGFAYDDPRVDVFHGRWLDTNDHRGGIIVLLVGMQPLAQYALVWDDVAVGPEDLVSPLTGGSRAVGAWDLPGSYAFSLQGAWDGDDYRRNSLYLSVYATMQAAKPAGVSAAVELLGE